MKLSENAIKILEGRYLLKDKDGNVVESPEGLFRRVARSVAEAELLYDRDADLSRFESEFYRVMSELKFLPNSPTLMNAGKRDQQLSACFVLPVEDSLDKIFDSVKDAALIHKSGGGTGFSFSRLRPKNDPVQTTHGISSGPISFMEVFNSATEAIKQGGARRGANMGVLRVDHPDIIDFIRLKETPGKMTNFNLSVGITDKFMEAVKKDSSYELINPRTDEVSGKINAGELFDLMAEKAWASGEPGILFLDRINAANPTPRLGEMESTNPCGEQPLLPYESCNLGSINLSKFVEKGDILWDDLAITVEASLRFLDNIIEVNHYPLKETDEITKANRKIGLGVMGFADFLIRLGIPYDSEEAVKMGGKAMAFIQMKGKEASIKLGGTRGPFPNYSESIFSEGDEPQIRNATVTTVAPTGTISLIAGCSSGIEPLFSVAYKRKVMEGIELPVIHPLFVELAKEEGFYSEALMDEVIRRGSIQEIAGVPEKIKRLFVTSKDIDFRWHVKMQAAFQKHTDNAVSKTINFFEDLTVDDVKEAFFMAHELGCKGLTLYRYGSRGDQPLNICDYCKGRRDGEL